MSYNGLQIIFPHFVILIATILLGVTTNKENNILMMIWFIIVVINTIITMFNKEDWINIKNKLKNKINKKGK